MDVVAETSEAIQRGGYGGKENTAPPPPPPRRGNVGKEPPRKPLTPQASSRASSIGGDSNAGKKEKKEKKSKKDAPPTDGDRTPSEQASIQPTPSVSAQATAGGSSDPSAINVLEGRRGSSSRPELDITALQHVETDHSQSLHSDAPMVSSQQGDNDDDDGPTMSPSLPVSGAASGGGLRPESSGEMMSPHAIISAGTPQLLVTAHSASPVGPNHNVVHPFIRVWLLNGHTGENLAMPANPNFGPEACCTTFPYDVRSRRSRAPVWEQVCPFYLRQAALEPHKDPTLFFELLDFGYHSIDGLVVRERLHSENVLYNIAWGFLKLFPPRNLGNGQYANNSAQFGHKVHLQLFPYPERTSKTRRAINSMTPAFLSHRAVNASGPTAPISSKSVLPYVFQVFSDKGNRCSPYSGGLSVTVSPCMTGDYDPNDASLLCTAYEEALEDYLWQVAGGRESGARRRLPPTQALEQKSRTSSKYAKSDFTRRRDERSLPPSIPIHEATVHGKITAVAMCPFNRLLAVASISNFSTIIQMYDILNPHFTTVASLKGHADLVHAMHFNADATLLASCSSDKTVKVWDISQLPRIVNSTEDELAICLATYSHGFSAYGVVFAVDVLIVGGYDTKLHVWPAPEVGMRANHSHPVFTAQHSTTAFFQFMTISDRTKVWVIDSLCNLMMWRIDVDADERFSSIHMRRRVECPGATTASVSGNVVAVTCPTENVMLLVDANSFQITHRIFTGKRTTYVPTQVLPDGLSVVVGTGSGRLLAWETKSGELCSSREGAIKGMVRFPIDLITWGTNQVCVVAQACNPETTEGRLAVLGRPRREGEVVKNNDPRAGDVIRSMFGGEVNLRATRAEALQEREEADVVTRDDGDLTRAPHTGDAATRMEQIMTYWNALVKKKRNHNDSLAPEYSEV